MVNDYLVHAYRPAAAQWRAMTSDALKGARAANTWLGDTARRWGAVKVLSVHELNGRGDGATIGLQVTVASGAVPPGDLRVQVVFGPATFGHEVSIKDSHDLVHGGAESEGRHYFTGEVTLPAGRTGYAIRVTAHNTDIGIVAETLAAWA
jgi:hypothetical protein